MQLFYAPEIAGSEYTLTEEESRHCVRVLRLTEGDAIALTDGRGSLYHGHVVEASQRRCRVAIDRVEEQFEALPYRLEMAVAPTKNLDRYEWFLEKATEVGCARFITMESAHSERRVFKPERGEKILVAAMKQSLKAYLPELTPLMPLRRVVEQATATRRFIAHCAEPRSEAGKGYLPDLLRAGEDTLILIGPEGDFSAEEIDFALAHGFEEISLGTQRLRTETAALVATVMVSVANNRQ